ncbi:MAG: hypothetical protein VYB15_10375, partial [Planctomycetota bacterium]|nr:hypothetical protein [Planctomycetota bacterium]
WAKLLLARADFAGWNLSKEFAAVAFNILLRRAQMLAVYHYVTTSRLFQSSMQDFETLTAKDFVTAALAAGECYTVRDALRKKNIDVKVKRVLKQMHIATRNVEATPAERAATRFKFLAMRIWNGCSFVFFTLNPHDIKTPLLIVFVHPERLGIQKVSLDWGDEHMRAYYEEVSKDNPLRLHELAAQNPEAAAKCVHLTFRMTIEILMNCTPPANVKPHKMNLDLVPALCEAGMFTYLSGYLGVVEPQMRFTEHMHALLQIFGYSHPEEFFRSGTFVDMFRRLWVFAAPVRRRLNSSSPTGSPPPASSSWRRMLEDLVSALASAAVSLVCGGGFADGFFL